MLYPKPKYYKLLPDKFHVSNKINIILSPNDVVFESAYNYLKKQLSLFNITVVNSINTIYSKNNSEINIRYFSNELIQKNEKLLNTQIIQQEESFILNIDRNGIVLEAGDLRGFIYGISTMMQLFHQEGENKYFNYSAIYDYAYKKSRGLHFFLPARDRFDFFFNLIDALAALRYNTIVLQVSASMEFQKHPEINKAWEDYVKEMTEYPGKPFITQHKTFVWSKNAMHIENAGGETLSQNEVRELIAYCKSRGMDVVPEVQSLSHCYWMLLGHKELAERKEDPYPDTYCPSNPAVYDLLFETMDEIIDVFKPTTLHIGHDEWYSIALCRQCKDKDAAQLLADNINKIYDYLKSRGIRTAMWSDKLMDAVNQGGGMHGGSMSRYVDPKTGEILRYIPATYRAIDLIPKDIILYNWYWVFNSDNEDYFKAKGFNEILMGNFGGLVMQNWDSRNSKDYMIGGQVSHWSALDEEMMANDGTMFDLAFSACMLWEKGYTDEQWNYLYQKTIDYMPDMKYLINSSSNTITSLNNISWKPIMIKKLDKHYIKDDGKDKLTPIAEIGHEVGLLKFTHGVNSPVEYINSADGFWQPEKRKLGYYELLYQDGTKVQIPLVFGKEISYINVEWNRKPSTKYYSSSPDQLLVQASYYAKPVITMDSNGKPITIYEYICINPKPEKPIKEVNLVKSKEDYKGSILVYSIEYS